MHIQEEDNIFKIILKINIFLDKNEQKQHFT